MLVVYIVTFAISAFAATTNTCNQTTGKDTSGKDCYIMLEPNAFPGISTSQGNDLNAFLGQVFYFGLAVAAALALIMMIWGGIEYMTTDAWQGKDDARKRITDALVGLGLAMISYIILYTINPCLVQFKASTATGGCKANNTFLNVPSTGNNSANSNIINQSQTNQNSSGSTVPAAAIANPKVSQ